MLNRVDDFEARGTPRRRLARQRVLLRGYVRHIWTWALQAVYAVSTNARSLAMPQRTLILVAPLTDFSNELMAEY